MGRYSIALNKIGPTCNPNNPCSGKYGKCLDLKLTNTCNGKCPFCIEDSGYSPKNTANVEELTKKINKQDIQTLLVLGGEPLMYPNIVKFLSLIRKDINIVVTTNGSLLTPDLAKAMTPYVKGMNISIHHSTSAKHEELTKIKLNGDILHKSIQAFGKDKIRINCNLVKGYVNTLKEVEAMYKFVERLGVKKIRFAELQNCPALYVDARTIFANIPADPFKDGCEITLHHKDLEVLLRVTCGIVNTDKDPIENPVGRNPQTQIMYSNGQVQDSWLDRNGSPVNDLDCHSARSYRGGCC